MRNRSMADSKAPERLGCKAVIVTGGGRGIGEAIARRSGAEGASAAVNHRSSAKDAGTAAWGIPKNGSEGLSLDPTPERGERGDTRKSERRAR